MERMVGHTGPKSQDTSRYMSDDRTPPDTRVMTIQGALLQRSDRACQASTRSVHHEAVLSPSPGIPSLQA